MKRTPLKQRPRRVKPAEVIERDLWRDGMGNTCALRSFECRGRIDAHHIITAQALRKRGLDSFVWDKRNRLPLCRFHHENHHSRSRPVPRELLPDCAWEFASELGLVDALERVYPKAPDAA